MSAFLGPVHVRMYDKVLRQDEMTEALLGAAEKQGWTSGLREQANAKAPAAVKAPLDTLIDPGNIHGWLSEAVSQCEARFALVANSILAQHPERLGELQNAMKLSGARHKLPAGLDAEEAFQTLQGLLLDGMPCDFPFQVTQSSPDAVVWQVMSCPHAPYWTAEPRGAEAYYLLRDAWLSGALEGSGITHSRTVDSTALRKEP